MTWIGVSAVDVSYATVVVPQMVLMGLGMGLVSTPATESILLVLPPARAGVGSAVNDATRELGATLGVAVVGSLFSSVFSSRLGSSAFAQLPESQLANAQESVTTAIGIGQSRPELLEAARESFMTALHAGTLLVAAVCLLGRRWRPSRCPAAGSPHRSRRRPRSHRPRPGDPTGRGGADLQVLGHLVDIRSADPAGSRRARCSRPAARRSCVRGVRPRPRGALG